MSDNEDYDEDEEEEVVVEPPEDLSHLIEVDLSCKGLTVRKSCRGVPAAHVCVAPPW